MFDSQAEKLNIKTSLRRRFRSVAMELFQNLIRHRSGKHLSLFRVRNLPNGHLSILTCNMTSMPSSEKLQRKFHLLQNTMDLKEHYLKKLAFKAENPGMDQGDLGLEICFRHTELSKLKVIPRESDLALVCLIFYQKSI